MKIIIPLVVGFGKHGGFRVLSKLADHWILSGHEVEFLVYQTSDQPYFPTMAPIHRYDDNGRILSGGSLQHEQNQFLNILQIRRSLRKALNRLECDVVLATQNFSAGPVAASSIKAKKFYYIQAYEPDFYKKGPLHFMLYRWIAIQSYKKGLTTIVNSRMYLNYKEIHSQRVVYPGLDLELFKPLPDKTRNKIFRLGTIGRTELLKGTRYVLDAFAEVRKELGEQVELHVAFGDADWGSLEGVKMFYPKNDIELSDFYKNLDCYLCGSYFQLDAVHYPVIESMACKVPVITAGYYPANSDNAYIVLPKNSDDMKEAVLHLFNNEREAAYKAAVGYDAVREVAWESVSVKMLDYFKA